MEVADKLYELAKEVRGRAYCPFSKFQVGAALKVVGSGKLFIGCNVENVSFGATICAERSAILSAVSELGKIEIESLCVVTDLEEPATPCGQCLQVISEFAVPQTRVLLANVAGTRKEHGFGEFMPLAFRKF